MSDPVTAIFGGLKLFVDALFGWDKRHREVSRDDRDRVAQYCIDVAECLDRCKIEFDQGRIPHGECSQMERLLRGVKKVLGDQVPSEERQEMERALEVACRVENLGVELGRDRHGTRFGELSVIAGQFRAVGQTLRATPAGS